MTGKKKGSKQKEKRTCNAQRFDLTSCGRKLYDEKHCIFHSKDIEGKKEKFNDAFCNEFERQKKDEKKYDFTGFVFPGEISFERKTFEKDVSFLMAQFSGEAVFLGAQFSGEADFKIAQFSEKTDFLAAKFSEKADFRYAQFSGEVDFRDAQFSERADFMRTQFSLAAFRCAKFYEKAIFVEAQFSGEADFYETQFSRVASFRFAKFNWKASFGFAKFYEKAIFVEAQFSGEASFRVAQFSGEADFVETQFFGVTNFRFAKFSGEADFTNSTFKGYTNFENITLEKYNSFSMLGTYFYNVFGLFESIETNKKKFKFSNKTKFLPDKFYLILGEETTALNPVFSRQIKDDMYLLDKKERISEKRGIPKIWNKLFYFLWWLTADYGRSFKRWLLCCFVIIFIFGAIFADCGAPDFLCEDIKQILYSINPEFHISPLKRVPTSFTPYYFSIVTFTTLGFGDVTPLNLAGEIWLAFEVLVGYTMLGGLISILANKLARRS